MKKSFTKTQCFGFALLSGFLFSLFLSFSQFDAACEDLRHNVLRLHIIANSDSEADQTLKLKIRDAVLTQSETLFSNGEDLQSAIDKAEENIPQFEEIANRVIKENGFSYKAKARVGKTDFNTREYEDFTLPAGVYNSLIITLGEGKGKNWWCVIYPEVCIPTASKGKLSDSVGKKGCTVAEQSRRYVMRFKIAEIYEEIKKYIKR